MLRFYAVVALCLTCDIAFGAESTSVGPRDWPAWRGPLGSGASPESHPPIEWNEKKNVKWKVAVEGRGHATPIVWGRSVFLLAAIETDKKVQAAAKDKDGRPGDGQGTRRGRPGRVVEPQAVHKFEVICLDRADGSVRWQKTANEILPHEGHFRERGSFASGSPITDGEHLYVNLGSFGVYCYDLDGTLKWRKDLGKMFMRRSFGEGSSPALHGKYLVLNRDQDGDSHLVALDKATGEIVWRTARDEPSSWGTPLVVEHEGRTQVVLTGWEQVRGYDLVSGDPVWNYDWESGNAIPSPIFGHGLIYVTSGHSKGGYPLRAIRVGYTGDLTAATEAIAWELNKSTPYVPSPLLLGDEIYLLRDKGMISCHDARTGKAHYLHVRLPTGKGYSASPVGAAEHIYLLSEDGEVVVVRRGPEFGVLATNSMDEVCFASPAVAGDELFLRGEKHVYCIAAQ